MKKNLTLVNKISHVLAGLGMCFFSATSSAALLGVQPGFPLSNYDNQGTTTFNGTSLNVNASLIEFKFMASDIPYLTFGSLTMTANLDAACKVTGNAPNPEITLVGDVYDPNTFALVLSGTLLTGEIAAVGVQAVTATTTAIDFRFTSAGGLLVSGGHWPAGKDIGAVLTVENSNFVDCVQAFQGGAKGSIGPIDPPPPPNNVGTGTQGYWKNHLSAWPLSSITVGGVTYTAANANNLLSRPPKGDQTWSMFRQLVAAMLNVAYGTNPTCIQSVIDAGNAWLTTYPLGSGVKASSAAWNDNGEDIHSTLDAYNNGQLCAPHRN